MILQRLHQRLSNSASIIDTQHLHSHYLSTETLTNRLMRRLDLPEKIQSRYSVAESSLGQFSPRFKGRIDLKAITPGDFLDRQIQTRSPVISFDESPFAIQPSNNQPFNNQPSNNQPSTESIPIAGKFRVSRKKTEDTVDRPSDSSISGDRTLSTLNNSTESTTTPEQSIYLKPVETVYIHEVILQSPTIAESQTENLKNQSNENISPTRLPIVKAATNENISPTRLPIVKAATMAKVDRTLNSSIRGDRTLGTLNNSTESTTTPGQSIYLKPVETVYNHEEISLSPTIAESQTENLKNQSNENISPTRLPIVKAATNENISPTRLPIVKAATNENISPTRLPIVKAVTMAKVDRTLNSSISGDRTLSTLNNSTENITTSGQSIDLKPVGTVYNHEVVLPTPRISKSQTGNPLNHGETKPADFTLPMVQLTRKSMENIYQASQQNINNLEGNITRNYEHVAISLPTNSLIAKPLVNSTIIQRQENNSTNKSDSTTSFNTSLSPPTTEITNQTLDIAQIAEQVSRIISRKMMIEKERRGYKK